MRTGALAVALFTLVAGGNAVGSEPFPASKKLLAADRAFAQASAEHGTEAWLDVWAEQGLLYGDGSTPVVGPQATGMSIRDSVAELRWEPTAWAMLWPNKLGFTIGTRWMRSDVDGRRSPYLTVWHRTGDAWKVVLNLSIPRQEESEAARDFDFWLGDWQLSQFKQMSNSPSHKSSVSESRFRGSRLQS